jgi:hypothetical protein
MRFEFNCLTTIARLMTPSLSGFRSAMRRIAQFLSAWMLVSALVVPAAAHAHALAHVSDAIALAQDAASHNASTDAQQAQGEHAADCAHDHGALLDEPHDTHDACPACMAGALAWGLGGQGASLDSAALKGPWALLPAHASLGSAAAEPAQARGPPLA